MDTEAVIDFTATEKNNEGPKQCRHCLKFLGVSKKEESLLESFHFSGIPHPWCRQIVCKKRKCIEKEKLRVEKIEASSRDDFESLLASQAA